MKLLKVKVGLLTAAGAAMAVMLSGGAALASPYHPVYPKTITGPEAIYGAVYGRAANAHKPKIPVTLVGVVNTKGLVFVTGGRFHSVPTLVGRLNVVTTGKPQITQTANLKNCYATFTVWQTLRVVGGTGAFFRAHGPGAYKLYHAAFYPRYKHKGCNFRARPFNKGAVLSFLGTAVLTVRT
jgi:hypothetical protein